jgi:hypothetical protein
LAVFTVREEISEGQPDLAVSPCPDFQDLPVLMRMNRTFVGLN